MHSSTSHVAPVENDTVRNDTVKNDTVRFDRLARTGTLRDGALPRWLGAQLFIVGAGNLGGRLAVEAVRAGARVVICDPDVGTAANLGTQMVVAGELKADSVAAACNAVLPGRALPLVADVRAVGVGVFARSAVIIDASDDARLAPYLTGLSNGLGVPLLRLAMDGSGEREFGRVLCSHGGAGHACQVCPLDFSDVAKTRGVTPCPGAPAAGTPPTGTPRTGVPSTGIPSVGIPPTLAGSALGMTIAGLGLLQAQRLVGGNDVDRVLDREVLLDLSHPALVSLELRRSQQCISGHQRWDLQPLDVGVDDLDVAGLLALVQERLGVQSVTVEAYAQPLSMLAGCACGRQRAQAGNRYGPAPRCDCGERMHWRSEVTLPRLSHSYAQRLGILDRSLASVGWPAGAMFVARAPGCPPLRVVLDPDSPRRSP